MADTLGFEPTERIPWRKDMTVSEMLDDIIEFQNEYKTARIHDDAKRRTEIKEIKKELLLRYFLSIMEGEDIGVQDEGETRQIMDDVDNEEDKGSYSSTPENAVNAEDANAMPADSLEGTSSPPDSVEMDPLIDSKGEIPADRKKQETINLYKAYKHIKNIVKEERGTRIDQNKSRENNIGLLEVETFILKTHKILMSELMDQKHGSRPGSFSENRRITDDGFEYPHFLSETLAKDAIQRLVDRHNETLDKMDHIEDKKQRVKYLFKCTSLFLSGFLLLHPFADGNGRIARLLCGYMLLRSLFPFTLPIYNVYSRSNREHYLEALKRAKPHDRLPITVGDENEAYRAANIAWEQKPELLCSMLIESNWCVWQEYRKMLKETGKPAERYGETLEVAN